MIYVSMLEQIILLSEKSRVFLEVTMLSVNFTDRLKDINKEKDGKGKNKKNEKRLPSSANGEPQISRKNFT